MWSWLVGLSLYVKEATVYDLTTHLIKKLLDCIDILEGWRLDCELAIRNIFFKFLGENGGHGPVRGQITLATNDDYKHIFLTIFQMFSPLVQLIKWVLIINWVAEDAHLSIPQEKMSQIMDLGFTSCVPNVELKLMILILFVGNTNDLCEVLDDFSRLFSLATLRISIHEDIDNRSFADILIAHKDDFGGFELSTLNFRRWLFLHLTTSFFFLCVAVSQVLSQRVRILFRTKTAHF